MRDRRCLVLLAQRLRRRLLRLPTPRLVGLAARLDLQLRFDRLRLSRAGDHAHHHCRRAVPRQEGRVARRHGCQVCVLLPHLLPQVHRGHPELAHRVRLRLRRHLRRELLFGWPEGLQPPGQGWRAGRHPNLAHHPAPVAVLRTRPCRRLPLRLGRPPAGGFGRAKRRRAPPAACRCARVRWRRRLPRDDYRRQRGHRRGV
mmetsp:Transcript_2056/g.4019  ORF Transcript_2056/g.4019 Transcript_2056/m.4019 type:complete len:201 (+) Transcript_2056:829-1431(+)